jgi:hypothetical protein
MVGLIWPMTFGPMATLACFARRPSWLAARARSEWSPHMGVLRQRDRLRSAGQQLEHRCDTGEALGKVIGDGADTPCDAGWLWSRGGAAVSLGR